MNKTVQRIIIGICLVIAVGCIGYLGYYYTTLHNNEQVYEEIQEEVYVEPVVTEETEEVEEVEESEPVDVPIDFDALHEINPDIYGWIEIEGTQIAYPILQSTESDGYYLNYTVEGVEGLPGSIYTELSNGTDFDVFNTIIYGHNMADDSMFGGLNLYRDLDYMIEHETIMIYLEDAILEYQVYAAVTFDNRHLMLSYNFSSETGCLQFLEDTFSVKDWNAALRDDVEVTAESQIITLSTCIGGQPENRLLVEAVLVNEQR